MGRTSSGAYLSSPIRPVCAAWAWKPSSWARVGAIHDAPCSVRTSFRLGKRSKTPPTSRWVRVRREKKDVSAIHTMPVAR